jgi:hypothetical protein
MNRLKPILFITVLALIGATAGMLAHAKSNQRLGLPGVKTRPLAGSHNLEVLLPEDLPGYKSEWLPEGEAVTNGLPQDTSYGQRRYMADDRFFATANVVLMGSSRASIHPPQVCLTAQGWNINDGSSHEELVHLDQPVPYDLPVMRLNATAQLKRDGQTISAASVYVYWFVDADRCTASHASRMMWMAKDLVLKGELDRWAYVSFFSVCAPGQEDATFERIKKLITASVPEFQLVPQPPK